MAGSFSAELPAYKLEPHRAAQGARPESTDPEAVGRRQLTVTATAVNPTTQASGSPLHTAVTKLAATPGDIDAPTVLQAVWPPPMWGHRLFATPYGEAEARGAVEDRGPGQRISEIADVIVTVRHGGRVIRGPFSAIVRTSATTARWHVVFRVSEFKPNYLPVDDKYQIAVAVVDAWGNTVETVSPEMTVYPL